MNDADVLIAGGGPVGLMLACELSLAGTRPRDTRDGEADLRDGEAGPRGIPADTDDASAGPRDALHHWFGEPVSSPAAGPPGPAPVPKQSIS
ncbi:MAG TPA: FAD-dependent monooxygenase [Streptosporangiaceae bacterium]